MYRKKRNNKTLLILIAVIAAFAVAMFAAYYLKGRKAAPKMVETEENTFTALIYKSVNCDIEYDKKLLEKETSKELKLSIKSGKMVTLVIHPKKNRTFNGISINASEDIDTSYNALVNDADGGSKRVNFVMPDKDILININFAEDATEAEVPVEASASETQSETQSEIVEPETNPYNLNLHGLTAQILASYNGLFDDQSFLQALGDQLHITSGASDYRGVTDVTFSDEKYTGKAEDGKVYHYVYLNNDPAWKVLATFYKNDKSWLFTEPEPETQSETQSETTAATDAPVNSSNGAATSGGGSTGGGSGSGTATAPQTEVTSFDIMNVSSTLMKFCGGQDSFYDQVWKYVLNKKLTGQIVGTMDDYKIDPGSNTATFTISLNTGGTINGTYDKGTGKYSLTGLS